MASGAHTTDIKLVRCRDALPDDLLGVSEIEQASFAAPWSLETYRSELGANPYARLVVALDEHNKPIGFIDYYVTFTSASIARLAVRKEYRHHGVASRLIREMISRFPKAGPEEVEAITLEVRASNEGAIAFYRKNGFERIAVKAGYYPDGGDALYMVRRLF